MTFEMEGEPEEKQEGEPQESAASPASTALALSDFKGYIDGEALEALDPRQTEALLAYIDFNSDTFGNRSGSARKVGASPAIFQTTAMENALASVRSAQLAEARHTIQELQAAAPLAADEIKSQLAIGKELKTIDPQSIFGAELEKVSGKDDKNRLREISRHNQTVAKLMQERRKVAELILAYAEGTPEQRLKVTRNADRSDLEAMLDRLTPEEFEDLGKALFGQDHGENGDEGDSENPVIDAEYELVD